MPSKIHALERNAWHLRENRGDGGPHAYDWSTIDAAVVDALTPRSGDPRWMPLDRIRAACAGVAIAESVDTSLLHLAGEGLVELGKTRKGVNEVDAVRLLTRPRAQAC